MHWRLVRNRSRRVRAVRAPRRRIRNIAIMQGGTAFAAMAILSLGFSDLAVAADGDRAGIAAAVVGGVKRLAFAVPVARRAGSVGTNISTGANIFLGDTIRTGPGGRVQILLLDQTSFTICANASMVIDEFVYDPRSGDGKISARVTKGAFRFVTGRIAAKYPSKRRLSSGSPRSAFVEQASSDWSAIQKSW